MQEFLKGFVNVESKGTFSRFSDNSRSSECFLGNFSGKTRHGAREKRFDFGGDPGMFEGFLISL